MSKPKFEDYEFEIRRIDPQDGGGYTITFPDLPGCRSDGGSLAETEANGRDAFEAWMEACVAEGHEVPKPGERDGAPAKFVQRVARYIHQELIALARAQGVSVNTLVNSFIVAGLERLHMRMTPSQSISTPTEANVTGLAVSDTAEKVGHGMLGSSVAEGSPVISVWDRYSNMKAQPARHRKRHVN
jgi:antitoxin HicB